MDRRRGRSGSSYCPNCGEELRASANFCPNCGAEREASGGGSATEREGGSGRGGRSRPDDRSGGESITDRDVLEYRITKAIEAGWELEHDFGDHAVMINRDLGSAGTHVLIALLTLWWTGGMGNALYAVYRYFAAPERIVLRAERIDASGARSRSDDESAPLSWWGAAVTAIVLWFGAAVAAAIAGSVPSLLWTIPFVLATAVFALGGVGVLPPVRRRLEDRRSVTTNGWVRSVDERSVVDPDAACTGCASPIRRGVERTYKKQFCVFGVPLSTSEGGTNHYCRRCANDDPTVGTLEFELDADGDGDGDGDRDTVGDDSDRVAGQDGPDRAGDEDGPDRATGGDDPDRVTDGDADGDRDLETESG